MRYELDPRTRSDNDIRRARQQQIIREIFMNNEEPSTDENENAQSEAEIAQIDRYEARERRHRRRRILRHLRNRGVGEETITAIRSIIEAALEHNESDTTEERVKICSRIDRLLFESDKFGDNENCPICCLEFEDKHHIKVLPVCNHIFHEDCIEQWIIKARSNCVL